MTPEFNKWWDGDDMTAENPYTKDTPAYWAWEGWVAGQKAKSQSENDFNPDWDAVGMLFEENQRLLCEISQLTKREWVGLTEEEWTYIWKEADTDMSMQYGREDAERMIEAKLKEKNHVD